MKIEQKAAFQPITITLDSADEAEAMFGLTSLVPRKETLETKAQSDIRALSIKISNWFSEYAQLGG